MKIDTPWLHERSGRPIVATSRAGSSPVTTPTIDARYPDDLTTKEQDIARLASEGLTNLEIAGRLFLSPGTVRNYVSVCLSKLYLTNRAQLTAWVLKGGLEPMKSKEVYNPDVYKDLIYGMYA